MNLETAVESICADARLSPRGRHGDYIRCILSQVIADCQQQAAWYALLARAANAPHRAFWLSAPEGVTFTIQGTHFHCDCDENGMPIRDPLIEAAIREALGETK